MLATASISFAGRKVVYITDPGRFDMHKGAIAVLQLRGVNGPCRWSADNDEVLDIDDDNEPTARITAASLGTSTVEVKQGRNTIATFVISVFKDTSNEATGFGVVAISEEVQK